MRLREIKVRVGVLRNERRDYTQRESQRCRSIDRLPEKADDSDTREPTGTLAGSRSERAALRCEQREQLESNFRENRAKGRKVRPITDVTSTALRKEEMAVRL
jgi:hypothetical protein